jgi:hypothetical protein
LGILCSGTQALIALQGDGLLVGTLHEDRLLVEKLHEKGLLVGKLHEDGLLVGLQENVRPDAKPQDGVLHAEDRQNAESVSLQ